MKICSTVSFFMKHVLLLAVFLLPAGSAVAAPVSFTREYTYQASDIDSKVSSRMIALEQVKRILLEEAGTYVKSETQVKDQLVTRDEVVTLTAGITSVQILDEKWDGRTYLLKARIDIDPEQVARAIDEIRQDTVESRDLQESRKMTEQALLEVARLRTELETARTGKPGQGGELPAVYEQKQREYEKNIGELALQDLLQRGVVFLETGSYQKALDVFGEAIRLNPDDKRAYHGHGGAYLGLEKPGLAIRDFDQAIRLDPSFAKAFKNRGKAYRRLGKYIKAIRDQDQAIKLNPEFGDAYFERGRAYRKLGEKKRGLEDIKRAAELGHPRALRALKGGDVLN